MINASNVTGFQGLIEYANIASNGWFGVGILLSLFTIITISMLYAGREKEGVAVAGFITTIIAILMNVIGLLPNLVLIMTIMIFFVLVLLLYWKSE